MQQPAGDVPRRLIGAFRGVTIEIVQVGAVGAEVELAVAGMFTHEVDCSVPVGGLRELDEALSGALTRLRADAIFTGEFGETIALAMPRPPVKAHVVLIVGLGDPQAWRPTMMTDTVRLVVREAVRRQATSVAFAPGLLDSGLQPVRLAGTSEAMMLGLIEGLEERGPGQLRSWSFCSGADGFVSREDELRLAFDQVQDE